MDCIFCKLANGEIPTNTVYEDANYRVIMDANPANPGHALVLPKKHGKDIFELDAETVAGAHAVAKKIAEAQMAVLKADGVNILQNNGEAAGQTVSHFHIHVIPRFKKDWPAMPLHQAAVTEDETKKICADLAAAVK